MPEEVHTHTHHHHEHHEHHSHEHHHEHRQLEKEERGTDSTSLFRKYMESRYHRKKLMRKCLWYAMIITFIALMLCVIYAYVLDREA